MSNMKKQRRSFTEVYCLGMCSILSERNGMKPGTIHYTKPGDLEYDLNFIKKDGKIYHHDGLTPTDGDMSAEPVPAKF